MDVELKDGTKDPMPDLLRLCRPMAERSSLPMAVVEGTTAILCYVNPAFCRLIGKKSEELTGKTFVETVREGEACLALLKRVYRTGEAETYTKPELGQSHPDSRSYVMWPVLDGDEHPIGVMIQVKETTLFHQQAAAMNQSLLLAGIRQHELTEAAEKQSARLQLEIDERKRAEMALRESESFYRQTIESIPGMVFTTRPDGYCDYQSQQWVDFSGVPMSEQLGYGWSKLLHPDDRPRALKTWQAAVEGRASYNLEYRIRRYDGQFEWFKVIARPIRSTAGQIVRWFGVSINIDEIKHAEEALHIAKDELEQRVLERTAEIELRAKQLSRLTSELALAEERERRRLAEILHDHLQQLLVGIRLNLDALSGHVSGDKKPILDTAHKLISDSIQTSRSITAELSPPILYQNGLVAGLDWLSRWNQEKYGFSVELQAEPEVITLKEDMIVVLFRSVRELLLNAIKHSGADSAKVILSKEGPDRLRIVVSDTGKGFDPDRIWESSEKQNGFGLFTIRERLEFLGGRFKIESAPGKGAVFSLVAPVAESEPAKKPVALAEITRSQAASKNTKLRILLVDDHAVVRQGLSMILDTQPDIEVVGQAADGEEAVKLAKEIEPDCILMDISLPGISGIEATRRIHAEQPGIRIICLSMFEDHEMASSALQSGATDYLSKSGDTDVLLSAIRGGERFSSQEKV